MHPRFQLPLGELFREVDDVDALSRAALQELPQVAAQVTALSGDPQLPVGMRSLKRDSVAVLGDLRATLKTVLGDCGLDYFFFSPSLPWKYER